MPKLRMVLQIDRCPHCGVAAPFLPHKHSVTSTDSEGDNKRLWRIYQCTRCGGQVLAVAYGENQEILEMYPQRGSLSDHIPEKARSYLTQAIDSLRSPAGAVMLTASAVDEMLKFKGYVEGSLCARIEEAENHHLITKEMALWAHQVRLDANDQRHADKDASLPDQGDAQRCVQFAGALAQFLFVLPALVERGLEDAEASNPQSHDDEEASS